MTNEESVLIPQTKLRVLGVILFSTFGVVISTSIMSVAAKYLDRSEFTLLSSLIAVLYPASVISGLIQIRSMTSTSNEKSRKVNWVLDSFQSSAWYRSIFYFALLFSTALTTVVALVTSIAKNSSLELLSFWMVSFFSITSAPFFGRYQSKGRVTEYFAVGAFSSLLRLTLVWISFALGIGISAYFFVFGLTTLVTGFFCGLKSRDMDWKLGSIEKSFTLPVAISLVVSIIFQFDLIFSSKGLSTFDAGNFVVAAQMCKMIALIALSASLTSLPAIMNSQPKSFKFREHFRKSIFISLITSAGLVSVVYLFLDPIVLFVFGTQFADSSTFFTYLVPGTITWSIFLTQINLNLFTLKLQILPFLLFLGCLQLGLISLFSSPEGYAISWSLTGTFAVLFFSYLGCQMKNRKSVREMG